MDQVLDRDGIGGNNPPPFERMSNRIESLLEGARMVIKDHPEIKDQETADKLAGFLKQLREAKKTADDERKIEKEPHLTASRSVDEKWNKIIDSAEKALLWINPRLTRWTDEQNRKRREAEEAARKAADEAKRKADEAEAEAQRQREAADKGELKGTNADPIAAEIKADELKVAAKTAQREANSLKGNVTVGGGYTVGGVKRGMAVRVTYSANIVNARAALNFFAQDPRILEALQTVADAAVRADPQNPPPGCEAVENKRVA